MAAYINVSAAILRLYFPYKFQCNNTTVASRIRECGSTLYVGMAQGVSFSLYIGIEAKFENTQKTGKRRLRTAEDRMVLL